MSDPPLAEVNDPAAPIQPTGAQLSRYESFGCCVAVLVVLALFIGGPVEQLLLGWLYYPVRRLWNLGGAAALAVTVIALTAAWVHRARKARPTDPGADSMPTARRRLGLLSLWLLVASAAAVGAAQQLRALAAGERTDGPSGRTSGPLSHAIHTAREQARRGQMKNELKQIGLAVHNTLDVGYAIPGGTMDENGTLLHGWAMALSAYMPYYAPNVDWSRPWNQPPNDRLYRCALPEYLNPAMPGPIFDAEGYGLSHVAGNMHVLPMQIIEHPRADQRMGEFSSMRDSLVRAGGSHTVLVGTIGERPRPWGYPANLRDPAAGINQSPQGFGGPAGWEGAMFLMCDGSVRFVGNDIAPELLSAMSGGPRGD